jgi:hypothetical protein
MLKTTPSTFRINVKEFGNSFSSMILPSCVPEKTVTGITDSDLGFVCFFVFGPSLSILLSHSVDDLILMKPADAVAKSLKRSLQVWNAVDPADHVDVKRSRSCSIMATAPASPALAIGASQSNSIPDPLQQVFDSVVTHKQAVASVEVLVRLLSVTPAC